MNRIAYLAAAGAFALAGCATAGTGDVPASGTEGTEATMCDREAGQAFIGQKATPETGEKLLAATGAKRLRWVPPRTAVTMDFQPDRLTVSYDDDMVITQVSCT